METRQHLGNLELLISVGKAISEKLDLESILQKLTDITTRLTGAEMGAFFYNMIDDKGESNLLFTLSGAQWESFEKFGVTLNTTVFQKTFSGEGILRSDNTLAVPVTSPAGEVIGGLFFAHSQPGMFTEEHEKLLTGIASQAAVAIDNAKLYEEVKTLNTRKDEFIGVAGHELKTPVTTIKGYLQLLEEQTPEGLTKDFIERALRQVNKLNRLITDLLDVTRIHAGKLDYTKSRCSLIDLVKECIQTVCQINTSHVIESKLPDNDLIVMVDSTKIEQVLINFLINAFKYSPGQNRIFVQVIREPGRAVVSVRDSGIGIPKQHLINIFHRYYRVNHSQYVIAGLGMGLYISKEIIDRHDGSMWVESEEGKGSTFYFALPLFT